MDLFAQIAYAEWHGMTPEQAADEWADEEDSVVMRWERVATAVATAEQERIADELESRGFADAARSLRTFPD